MRAAAFQRAPCLTRLSEVGVDFAPLRYGGHNVERHELIAHLAEVLIAGIEGSELFGSAFRHGVVSASGVEDGLHRHHDVLVLLVLHEGADGIAEGLATHDCANHFYRHL